MNCRELEIENNITCEKKDTSRHWDMFRLENLNHSKEKLLNRIPMIFKTEKE